VLSVAASNEKDKLASFSNWGEKSVDLAAPGDSIASTAHGGEYSYVSGTSMAAPLVAAAAAMVREHGDGLPYARVRTLLLKYADDKSAFKEKVASGGRLNIRRSLKAAG
jgi:thermitase